MIRSPAVAGTALLIAIAGIYVLRLNDAAGLMVDDAWYVVFAKGLYEGRGYRMISSATTPMLPLYPPGFSLLLSLAFLVDPRFPENIWLLKSVSIAAMAGVGALTYSYLHRDRRLPRDLAVCTAVAIVITPSCVFLATSTVMSECVFTLSQLACIVVLHRSSEHGDSSRGRQLTIFAGIVGAATVLIRTAGVALPMAAALWLIKDRRWKQAALFGAVVVSCVAPWAIYASVNAPTREQRVAHGGAVSYGYTEQLGMRWAGSPSLGRVTVSDIPARVAGNLVDVFARDVGGFVVPVLFRGPAESGEEVMALGGRIGLQVGSMGGAIETIVISLLLSVVAAIGYVKKVRERITVAEILVPMSLSITLLWPFWTFRFVLPLTPFLFLYLLTGMHALGRGSSRAVRVGVLCVIGLHLYDHAGYLLLAKSGDRGRIQWLADARRVGDALEWLRTGLGDGILASTNPALVYLRIGRKGIALDDPAASLRELKERGIRYGASFVPTERPDPAQIVHTVLYESGGPSPRVWVIRVE